MPRRVAVVGAGRVGLTLARALARSGSAIAVLARESTALPAPLEPSLTAWGPALESADAVLVAVPDDAIGEVAARIAECADLNPEVVVLHTSGLHDRSALAVLGSTGAALGSWHPLQTLTRSEGEPDALAGATVVIEGDAPALAMGRAIARQLGIESVVEIAANMKASYHAAAVFASNYVVTLADVAERLARHAGAGEAAATMFLPLLRRTVENLSEGPAAALTGPIRRGDAGTVARHLQTLDGEQRELYVMLARATLRLAEDAGLDPSAAGRIRALLY